MIIDGKLIANTIKEELKKKIDIKNPPILSVIQIGNNVASNIYIKRKEKMALELGIVFNLFKYEETITEEEVIAKIKELNTTSSGIFVQMPIPKTINKNNLINAIDYKLDVDGLGFFNQGGFLNGEAYLLPCTPSGILKMLEYYKVEIEGKNAVVVGRGHLVGLPIANLLVKLGATVTVTHTKTVNLSEYTKKADILIAAAGSKHLIKADMVKDGVVVIDVGMNKEDIIYGDVDFTEVSKKASLITPVPGGVGPMTVIMLMQNIITAHGGRND